MNVLHVYSGNLYGGIETLLVTLARRRGLCDERQPSVALCYDGRLSRELAAAGIVVHRLPTPRASQPLAVRRARRALADLLARTPFDCVICHAAWSQAFFGGVVRRAGVPLVFWAHDAVTGRHWTERIAKRIAPDLAICNSAFTANALTALYPRVPTRVIANPVDVERVTMPAGERQSLRRSLGADDSSVVIIQTSRLEAWKGHRILIDALGRLSSRADWTCWIAGGAQRAPEREYVTALRERAERLGIGNRLRWLGERQDIRQLLFAADVHCQPNTGPEPFGIAFIEALAAGLPVVATAIGGALEIVNDRCGRLVPAGDAPALADTLQLLIADPELRRRLAGAGPSRARQLCDPAVQLPKIYDALAQAAPVAESCPR
ncbi:MAG TPA: glycosyltransferase family 4 protein [Vicinamibacterales bacterium]|nr:glycosyltransferase family 4 protein [Vicinamibacterales bacterium]